MASDMVSIDAVADDRGLTRELSAEECITLAGKIGDLRGTIDLVAGDVINQFTKRLGLNDLTERIVKDHGNSLGYIDVVILGLCKSMGYSTSYAAANAAIARSWKRGDRVSGLGFAYYRALQGCDGKEGRLSREQARQILLEAQAGYWNAKGEHVKPHPVSWVKKRRADLEGNTEVKVHLTVQKKAVEISNSIIPDVEKALLSSGLSDRKAKAQVKKVEAAIQKIVKGLEDDFFSAVRADVAKQVKQERAEYVRDAEAARAERKRHEALFDGITRPVEEEEYRFLRQFCHPDKHPGNEDKARKAYEIVERLGARMQFHRKAS